MKACGTTKIIVIILQKGSCDGVGVDAAAPEDEARRGYGNAFVKSEAWEPRFGVKFSLPLPLLS